ncbi:uncharacterized protein LOC119370420 [Jatropha curcas]|uniref:uncharacterized protein LOC119370420 n=1 Tax=Jatropha curcas TaxID=180498 RepID=UPI0018959130|nr:uncharacterized protein LOC119370420 [Jatropha curcas]
MEENTPHATVLCPRALACWSILQVSMADFAGETFLDWFGAIHRAYDNEKLKVCNSGMASVVPSEPGYLEIGAAPAYCYSVVVDGSLICIIGVKHKKLSMQRTLRMRTMWYAAGRVPHWVLLSVISMQLPSGTKTGLDTVLCSVIVMEVFSWDHQSIVTAFTQLARRKAVGLREVLSWIKQREFQMYLRQMLRIFGRNSWALLRGFLNGTSSWKIIVI